MGKAWHWVAHIFGWNTGEVVTWWDIDALFVGFQCDECGEVSGQQMLGVYHYPLQGEPFFKWHWTADALPRRVRNHLADKDAPTP